MTADETLTGGRRGRRARAMDEEHGHRRRGATTSMLLVRRASVEVPAFDSPMPVMERFEARTLEGNRPFIGGAGEPAGESPAMAGGSASDAPTLVAAAPISEPVEPEPVADEPAAKKKSGWSLFGRKKPVVAPNANVDVISADPAPDADEPDYDIETANATDTTAFDPSEIDAYERQLESQTTEEAVETASVEPDLPDDPDAAIAADVAYADAGTDHDGADAEDADTQHAGLVYDPDSIPVAENGPADLELGTEDPALHPVDDHATLVDDSEILAEPAMVDETSSDIWTSPPLTMDRDLDGVEFGELARESAPDPRPAPRFTGTVLNKPARTGAGVGAWITWILVVAVLVVLILLLVFGVIGPGVLKAAAESPVQVISALSPPLLF